MRLSRVTGWVVGLMAVTTMAQERPDLIGNVVTEDGAPIPEASVFVYTAGPRVGPGYI
jgi:hypothetical protein